MGPDGPKSSRRYWFPRGAILAVMILAVADLLLKEFARATPAAEVTSEAAPQVKPAIDGVFDLFNQKPVVALSDAHGVAQEEVFYSALVRDPRFAEQIGNVVVEFGGSAAQGTIDRYVNGEDVPLTELRHVWTDVVGWIPGPFSLGYINFFANVRAANLKLPAERRIKVWLGDPKVDWTKISSLQDLGSSIVRRDENIFGIIDSEILKKQKKTLVIIGGGHLVVLDSGQSEWPFRPLGARIAEAYPNAMAVVSPFTGYIEPECNAKVVARAKDWPVPALVGPIQGTWLKSELQLPGCNYVPQEQLEQMKKMAPAGPPPSARVQGPAKLPSPADMIAMHITMLSGVKSDALLYLGPPDSLTVSPIDPTIYLDPDYFKEMSRRAQCCTPFGHPLDWDNILQENSVAPRKFQMSAPVFRISR